MSYQPPGNYGEPAPGTYGNTGPTPGGLGERFVARLIDGILLGVISFVLGIILALIFGLDGINDSTTATWAATAIAAVLGVVITFGYFVGMETSRGQTLGKMAMKLKVMGPGGAPVTVEQSVKRNIFYALGLLAIIPLGSFLSWIGQIAAYIAVAVTISQDTALRQGWHDKFAKETYVAKIG